MSLEAIMQRINALNSQLDWIESMQGEVATHSRDIQNELATLQVKSRVMRHYIRIQTFTRHYK